MWHKFLSRVARWYLRSQVKRRPPADLARLKLEEVNKVLVLNATGLGDLLFSTPAIRALKDTYPEWQVDVLAHRRFAPLLEHNPGVARLWRYPGRGLKFLQLMGELARQQYQLVIILHGNDPEATLLARATGSPYIIGSASSPLSFCYSGTVSCSDPYRHAVERRLDYVRLVGAETGSKKMEVFLTSQELEAAKAVLGRYFGTVPRLLVAMHPTGSAPYKWWPLPFFAEVGDYLYRHRQAAFLILSGSRDKSVAEKLAARLPGRSLLTGGRFSLRMTAALLHHCRLLLANDSGPWHLGLALKVPSCGILGADHPRRIGPYQADWGTYIYKKEEVCLADPCLLSRCASNRCLQIISPTEVIRRLQEWWEPRYPH